MAYDLDLAQRVEELVSERPDCVAKKMFGGLAFLINGNIAVVVSSQGGLMVRVGPDDYEAILDSTPAKIVAMQGRPMTGWVRVEVSDLDGEATLKQWVDRGVGFAKALPAK